MPVLETLLRPGQLLALAVGLQVLFVLAIFWRTIMGKPQATTMRPRWFYLPLLGGTLLGIAYGFQQGDFVFVLAQALALFMGVCVMRTRRGAKPNA